MTAWSDTALIVFAKAPLPGLAKTRLIPALGADGAAALAAQLLRHTLAQAVAAGFDALELCVAPDEPHPLLRRAAARHGAQLTAQGDGDRGARRQRALSRRLARHGRVLLIGTDAPALDAAALRAAAHALASHDAVLVPALDGGYALVGLAAGPSTGSGRTGVGSPFGLSLSKPAPAAGLAPARLFQDIAWSTPQVMAQTIERLAELGLHAAQMPALADIDEPADLVHLPPHWLSPSHGAASR
jgi:rSAM/selenodomain-associated transferase 1